MENHALLSFTLVIATMFIALLWLVRRNDRVPALVNESGEVVFRPRHCFAIPSILVVILTVCLACIFHYACGIPDALTNSKWLLNLVGSVAFGVVISHSDVADAGRKARGEITKEKKKRMVVVCFAGFVMGLYVAVNCAT